METSINGFSAVSPPRRTSFLLVVSALILSIPANWLMQYFFGMNWPDWLYVIFHFFYYIIISLLIWVEREHLDENNIDLWSLILFFVFGVFLQPVETANRYLRDISCISYTIIALILIINLHGKHVQLSRSYSAFRWLYVSVIFACLILWCIATVHVPLTGISGPTKSPIINHLYSILFNLSYIAIPEEAIFRGFLWGILNRMGFNNRKTLFIQAALFTAAHIRFFQPESIISYIGIFIFSLFVGFLAWKAHSIFPGIFTHAFHDYLSDLIR